MQLSHSPSEKKPLCSRDPVEGGVRLLWSAPSGRTCQLGGMHHYHRYGADVLGRDAIFCRLVFSCDLNVQTLLCAHAVRTQ